VGRTKLRHSAQSAAVNAHSSHDDPSIVATRPQVLPSEGNRRRQERPGRWSAGEQVSGAAGEAPEGTDLRVLGDPEIRRTRFEKIISPPTFPTNFPGR